MFPFFQLNLLFFAICKLMKHESFKPVLVWLNLCSPEIAKLLLSSINCFQLHNLFLLFNSNLYVDFNYTFFEFLLLSISQKCALTIMQIINVLSEIDFKCQRKHPIILPETQLSKDGSGAGFKVGKVKLHFEVHGLAFSIISCCPQQA